jgi:hypothetical protein
MKRTRIYKSKNKKISKRRKFTGGNSDQVKCCICEKIVNKENTLIPNGCLKEHGKAGHRICTECWWNPQTGFAREGITHRCPGCIKGLLLTPYKKEETITIDLTVD